jgi:DNA-binding PadR family transcriptional regulator
MGTVNYVLRSYVPRSSVRVVVAARRANDPSVLILTSLAGGPKHGHALAKDIQEFAGVVLGPGTLYGAITRLEERGLIAPVESHDRRRPYRITGAGSEELTETLREMRRVADTGAARLGLTGVALS